VESNNTKYNLQFKSKQFSALIDCYYCHKLAKPGTCPKPWKGYEGICDFRGDMCGHDSDCGGDDRCCFNGCQNDCVPAGIKIEIIYELELETIE